MLQSEEAETKKVDKKGSLRATHNHMEKRNKEQKPIIVKDATQTRKLVAMSKWEKVKYKQKEQPYFQVLNAMILAHIKSKTDKCALF